MSRLPGTWILSVPGIVCGLITNRKSKLIHFCTLSPQLKSTDQNIYSVLLSDLKRKFQNRFNTIKGSAHIFIIFIKYQFFFKIFASVIFGLQCDLQLIEKFKKIGLVEFYKTYLNKNRYQDLYKQLLFICLSFGSTCRCRQLFSRMKHIKQNWFLKLQMNIYEISCTFHWHQSK